ncbi:MAG: hypothetical protein PHT05_09685 [Clostridia bacterium]|nr:hypothetical protein [Clostridia bacterium]MDI9511815.1 hypothetical protein [Bacillota bacterium]
MKKQKDLKRQVLFICLLFVVGLFIAGFIQAPVKPGLSVDEASSSEQVQGKNSLDMDSFYNLKKHIIKDDFDLYRDEKDFLLSVEGKYDLNQDGELDKILASFAGGKESLIEVNGHKITVALDKPVDFYLIDLIQDDGFIEIGVYDDGPSADPKTTFYRYSGKRLYKLATINTDIKAKCTIYPYYGNVLTDGKGKIIGPDHIAKFLSPNIVKGYYSIEGDRFKLKSIDYKKYLEDEYTFTSDFDAFFVEKNLETKISKKDLNFSWDENEIVKFKRGERVKVILVGDFWYGVRLQDGRTGLLYFWIGD